MSHHFLLVRWIEDSAGTHGNFITPVGTGLRTVSDPTFGEHGGESDGQFVEAIEGRVGRADFVLGQIPEGVDPDAAAFLQETVD